MKRILLFTFVILFICLILPQTSPAAAIDVLKAFKKVENLANLSPSNSRDFLNAFVDAKTEADLFFNTADAKKRKLFTEQIRKVCNAYDWSAKFLNLKNMRREPFPYVHEKDEVMQHIYRDYPDCRKTLGGTIKLSDVIIYFNAQAEHELFLASKYFNEKR